MKRVSFKVAKAIKEAGYPQDELKNPDSHWFYDEETKCDILRVTYLEVWLWLWREKRIPISVHEVEDDFGGEVIGFNVWARGGIFEENGPEEAIIAAIEYLVDNGSL